MNDEKKYYIGFDIGGTKCAATLGGVCGDEITVICKNKFLTAGLSPCEVLDRFAHFTDEQIENHRVSGIGISCGGPLDAKRGVIISPPNLPLWDNIEIVRFF